MSFRTVTKPHMKKTVVTTFRARPVFWGAVAVDVLVMGRFMGSRASITDFAGPGTDLSVPRPAFGRVWGALWARVCPRVFQVPCHMLPCPRRYPYAETCPHYPGRHVVDRGHPLRPDRRAPNSASDPARSPGPVPPSGAAILDRKSTRLNSSHRCISYALFCL